MFKNIGKKIMGLAKFITWLGIISSGVCGVGCCVAIMARDDDMIVLALLAAVAVFVVGALVSWIGSFLLYGFGQLIHNSEESKQLLKEISEQKPEPAPVSSGNGDGGNGGFGGSGSFEELAGKIKF